MLIVLNRDLLRIDFAKIDSKKKEATEVLYTRILVLEQVILQQSRNPDIGPKSKLMVLPSFVISGLRSDFAGSVEGGHSPLLRCPTDVKFGKHVSSVEFISTKNKFCRNQLNSWLRGRASNIKKSLFEE
ncbi:hypothetical protein TNCV_2568071 [Trichonephila clavipes]|uniref:Uncharacterized protein n=1 Tax=Trichonephila clavipes TaxID=2585209 RepID=A0A8X6WKY5_TRICX|nr:hypothetical protein TNCV_2568071 [Trichonephila clavipes]